MTKLTVHAKPCSGCPYRKDCPSGVWHPEEYDKLRAYDQDTSLQPIAVFLCHDGDRKSTVCRGWLGHTPQGTPALAPPGSLVRHRGRRHLRAAQKRRAVLLLWP